MVSTWWRRTYRSWFAVLRLSRRSHDRRWHHSWQTGGRGIQCTTTSIIPAFCLDGSRQQQEGKYFQNIGAQKFGFAVSFMFIHLLGCVSSAAELRNLSSTRKPLRDEVKLPVPRRRGAVFPACRSQSCTCQPTGPRSLDVASRHNDTVTQRFSSLSSVDNF